jgi:hypothetical protein
MKLTFKYHGDRIVTDIKDLFLNIFRKDRTRFSFFSESYGEYFNHFSDYWQMVGRKGALIELIRRPNKLSVKGFHLIEVLAKFTRSEFPGQPVVIMFDIQLAQIARLVEKMPGTKSTTFTKDVVVILCKHKEEAEKIVNAAPLSLGVVFAVQDGITFDSNIKEDEIL